MWQQNLYVRKGQRNTQNNLPIEYVKLFAKGAHGSNQNMTYNWLTFVSLMETMLTDYNSTLVETIHKNKENISWNFLSNKRKAVLFLYLNFMKRKP